MFTAAARPVIVTDVGERGPANAANRIVDGTIQPAECFNCRAHHALNVFGLADIGIDENSLAACLGDQPDGLFAALGIDIDYHNAGTFACKQSGAGPAQPAP